jgi:hypothetical protein
MRICQSVTFSQDLNSFAVSFLAVHKECYTLIQVISIATSVQLWSINLRKTETEEVTDS